MLPGVCRAAGLGASWLVAGCSLGVGGLAASNDANLSTADSDAAAADPDDAANIAPPRSRPSDDASDPHPAASDAATVDASTSSVKDSAAPPSGCANSAGPCVAVPSGWTLVAYAPAQASPCPTGFDTAPSQDLLEGPNVTAACGCGACTVTQQPSCTSGAIAVTYDTDFSGTCNQVAMPSPLGNTPAGACGTDIYQGSYAKYDVQYAAPPPTGGACTSAGVQKNGSVTYASKDRVCQPNDAQASNCSGGVCQPKISGPYAACIAAPGAVACPAGPLSVAHQAAASAAVTCADCSCSVTSTCSGTLTLYTDTACKSGSYAISTDVCVGISSAATYKAYEYTGAAPKSVACEAGVPNPAQSVTLAGEQTICCAQ